MLTVPEDGQVDVYVTNMLGTVIGRLLQYFTAGRYSISYSPSSKGVSLVSARYESQVNTQKIIYIGPERGHCRLSRSGMEELNVTPKSSFSALS